MNDIYRVEKTNSLSHNKFGEIVVDGYFATAVGKEMLKNDESINKDVVDNVFQNATEILNECPNPKGTGEFKRTGIVIGKVQSGKTSNFIALLALAFDNGYNISIVIGGNTTELLTQNVERIKKSFNVSTDKLVVLHSKNNHKEINPDSIKQFIDRGVKVIIVTLKSPQEKNKKHMTRVSELFDNFSMANENTIIIDDEGDQATLNSKVYSKKESDRLAKTYKVAIEIKSKIKRHCFISVNATPQANILIKTNDVLSPDFVKLIEPGRGYCGLSVFHGEEQDKFIKVIPESENSLLDDGIPASFQEALAAFYVSNAIRKSRGDDKIHSMLIHPSMKKFDHTRVEEKVDYLVKQWQAHAKNGVSDVGYVNDLRPKLLNAYQMYRNEGVALRSFEDIEPQILECIGKSSNALVFNSDQVNARSDAELYRTRIYIGGNILDRGITIKGLAITYIIRRAKGYGNVDNIEQRARWFGYKNIPGCSDYIDICRVWATKLIKEDFASINESDEDMWDAIQRNIDSGKSFKDLPRYFILQDNASHRLRLTRPSVAKTEKLYWSEWKTQTYYISDKNDACNNMQLLEEFKQKCSNSEIIDYSGENKHLFVYDIKLSEFIETVLRHFVFNKNEMDYVKYLTKLDELLKKNNLDDLIDLVWVRTYSHESRFILENGKIQQLFRGRDIKLNTNGQYNYLGDRSTCNIHKNKIQIQIHYVKASNMKDVDFYSPALCFYIPNDYFDKINIVGRKEDEQN